MIRTPPAADRSQPAAAGTTAPAPVAVVGTPDTEDEDMTDDAEEDEEESSEGSVGSLVDFIQDEIKKERGKNRTADVVPENIITGKRVRKPVVKYMDKRYGELMTDIPPEEVDAALEGKSDSEESTNGDPDSADDEYLEEEEDDASSSGGEEEEVSDFTSSDDDDDDVVTQ